MSTDGTSTDGTSGGSGHAPKLRALRALQRQQLSAAGTQRLEQHLDTCVECTRALAGLRLAEQLMADARDQQPELDFARIEAQVSQRLRARRSLAFGLMVAPALAAAVVLLLMRSSSPEREPGQTGSNADQGAGARVPDARATTAITAVVTALAGRGSLQRQGSAAPERLQLDSELRELDRLSMDESSVAHVRVGSETGFIVGPGSELRILRLTDRDQRFELSKGRITQRVEHLAAQQSYVIEAAGYAVSVRGTHFEVDVEQGRLGVAVREGRVWIQDRAGSLVAELGPDQVFGSAAPEMARTLERPRTLGLPLADYPPVTLLDLGTLAPLGVDGLVLDGTRAPASGQLAMRVPRGDVTLVAWMNNGRRVTAAGGRDQGSARTTTLHVPAEGLSLAPEALRKLLRLQPPPQPTAAKVPGLAYEEVLGVVRAGTPALQRCYERALRVRPQLDARLTLRLQIGSSGRVAQVAPLADAANLPTQLVDCIRNVSRRWQFPSGEPALFDVPLRLSRASP